MNLAPDTTTIEAQRNTELLLLDYLRSTNPHIYALWCAHPEHNNADAESSSSDSGASAASASSSRSPQVDVQHRVTPGCESGAPADATGEEEQWHDTEAQFHRTAHAEYASTRLQELPTALQGMYPSRPWVAYWCLQAADLLGVVESDLFARTPPADIAAFLCSCLSHDTTCEAEVRAAATAAAAAAVDGTAPSPHARDGLRGGEDSEADSVTDATARPAIGFAGGPVHLGPHLAASYAACCALAVLAGYDGGACLRRLPRAAIKRWLLTLRHGDDGSFRVHGGGESDIRASYCAAVLTSLLCLDDPSTFDSLAPCRPRGETDGVDAPREYVADVQYEPVLTLQTAKFVAACQTHEGGFTCSATASEAHGAYTQCGLAALLLMKQPHLVYQPSLRRWLAARQLNCEGGFNGRTNKLVDSCYSHWIGASHVLLRTVEAFTKCFTPITEGGQPRQSTGEAGEATALCAREVVLLDHAQLLDATCIQVADTAVWDRAETTQFTRVDLVDQFLCAEDNCLRKAAAKRAAASALYDDVLRGACAASPDAPAEVREAAEGTVTAFHRRQAFLYQDVGDFYFNQRKLQDYVLRCCQDAEIGGLMDKPGTAHDAYHTCYSMSGMSAAQNLQYLTHAAAASSHDASSATYLSRAFAQSYLPKRGAASSYGVVLSIPGPSPAAEAAVLRTTSPIFNIHQSGVLAALKVWGLKSFL